MRLPPFIIIYISSNLPHPSVPPFGRARVGLYFSSAPFHPLPVGGPGWVPTFSPLPGWVAALGGSGWVFYFMSRYGILSISP